MKQILRKGLKDIIVDEVPDPVVSAHHILVRPIYSLISSGTETASIHKEGVARAVANDPSQLGKVWNAMKGSPIRTLAEVKAKSLAIKGLLAEDEFDNIATGVLGAGARVG